MELLITIHSVSEYKLKTDSYIVERGGLWMEPPDAISSTKRYKQECILINVLTNSSIHVQPECHRKKLSSVPLCVLVKVLST